MFDISDTDYNLTSTSEILLTSEKGDRLACKDNVEFIVTQDFAFDDIEDKKIHIQKSGKVILK